MSQEWHLQKNDFFHDIPKAKESFIKLAKCKQIRKNSLIFFEDEIGRSCYYLEKGLVKISRVTVSGKEPIYFLRQAGDFFGLAEVLDGLNRKANAQAITTSTIYEISTINFERCLSEHSEFNKKIIGTLGRRIRFLGEQLANLMSCTVEKRLAKQLVYLGYKQLNSEKDWQNPVIIQAEVTQEQLASLIGSSQQTISENLTLFKNKNLIQIKKKKITILNPLKLLKLAEM